MPVTQLLRVTETYLSEGILAVFAQTITTTLLLVLTLLMQLMEVNTTA